MQFEIHRASGGQYYWRIVASNGKVLATSESYYSKEDVQSAIESIKQGMTGATVVDST